MSNEAILRKALVGLVGTDDEEALRGMLLIHQDKLLQEETPSKEMLACGAAIRALLETLPDKPQGCRHESTKPYWDFVRCDDCGWVMPSGQIRGPHKGWFPSMEAVKLFDKFGTYPGMKDHA